MNTTPAKPEPSPNGGAIRCTVHPRIATRDSKGCQNGYLIPLYNIHDGFFSADCRPQQVYLTVIAPRACKGPHLHRIRTGFFTCVRGNIRVILKLPDGSYLSLTSGEDHEFRSIEVPTGVAALLQNLGSDEAFVLNMPSPAWTPEMNDEHTADFSDCRILDGDAAEPGCESEEAEAGDSRLAPSRKTVSPDGSGEFRRVGKAIGRPSDDPVTTGPPDTAGRAKIEPVTRCRTCGGSEFLPVLDLGAMPPANSYLKLAEALNAEKFPLRLCFCPECRLVQLEDRLRPDLLYRHYEYMSSASAPLVEYFSAYGRELVERFDLGPGELVVEIGGNDGVLLDAIRGHCRVLNVEPAQRLVDICRRKGISATRSFFSSRAAARILAEWGPARIVTASNVVAHIDDLQDLFAGIRRLLAPNGIFAVEVHWVGNLIGDGGFDQIYHEHLSYFSLTAFSRLAADAGLPVFDVELTPMHGALLRIFLSSGEKVRPAVTQLLERERELGLDRLETYQAFAGRARLNIEEFSALIAGLRAQGKRIAGYGAPAKGNTLLNACRIDHRSIEYIVDTTPFKQWLYSPGGRIPVVPPEVFRTNPPDYAVLLAWNYTDAILRKEEAFRKRGGRFIVPVPQPRIV